MLKFWRNCKLGVKLQAAFALVMLVFVAALVAVFIVNAKVAAVHDEQSAKFLPAQMNILLAELAARSTESDGAYYIMEPHPAAAARYLLNYRNDLAGMGAAIGRVNTLSPDAVTLEAAAVAGKFLGGPRGYLAGNEKAFALKAAGKPAEAAKMYFASSMALIASTGEGLRSYMIARVDAKNTEEQRLQALAKTLSISLGVLALLLGFAIATLMSRSISRAIGATTLAISGIVSEDIAALTLILKRLAGGDLTGRFISSRAPLKVSGADEIGALVKTYNALAAALGEMAAQYTAATDNLRNLISVDDGPRGPHPSG